MSILDKFLNVLAGKDALIFDEARDVKSYYDFSRAINMASGPKGLLSSLSGQENVIRQYRELASNIARLRMLHNDYIIRGGQFKHKDVYVYLLAVGAFCSDLKNPFSPGSIQPYNFSGIQTWASGAFNLLGQGNNQVSKKKYSDDIFPVMESVSQIYMQIL